MWATVMPMTLRGRDSFLRMQSIGSTSDDRMIHTPSVAATGLNTLPCEYTPNTRMTAVVTATRNVINKVRVLSRKRPLFQLAWTPTDSSASNGSIDNMNVGLKYGVPTDSVPRPRESAINGAIVPPNTVAAPMTSRMLLKSRKDSRAPRSNPACDLRSGARQAYRVSAPPIMMIRKARMKIPRVGSAANECTDTSTPERTRNVPNRLRENARIHSNRVQLLNSPRLSVTASE